ncbi:hypothetical protein [Marinobacter piscensis]|uniref:hypothetical protein n=1 Tax=Marinobacter piscensis TaxID=1562308 RepID=UPI0011A29BBF|nr:hypothetical protein [Marinobacter piscensis]
MANFKVSSGLGFIAGTLMATTGAWADVIFEENFDSQPDWTSAMHSTDTVQRAATHIIPKGWYSIRQAPQWAPSKGYAKKHEAIEILASNADKSRNGSGKSFVSYRDSYDAGWNYWASESILLKYLPEGYDQLYVEFWIRFGPNWTRTKVEGLASATSKIFRVSSWSGDGSEYGAFSDGNIGPIALWDHKLNNYGMRVGLALRGGPHSDNYKFTKEDISDLGRFITAGSLGDLNMSYKSSLAGLGKDGSDPKIVDRVNGGYITKNSEKIEHDNIFGPDDSWTKLGFFVKMNSAPNVKDGEFRMFLSDQQIVVSTKVPWIRSSMSRDEDAKWNLVAIGGNDFFQTYPNESRHEEWYSIDDIVIRTDIPDYVNSDVSAGDVKPASPNSPIKLQVR